MTDYFERIETRLLDAVERQAVSRRRWRQPTFPEGHAIRVTARWGIAAAAVAVVVLVFLGALVLGGSHSGSPAAGAAARPSRAQLVSLLGVLRRAQTSTDRAFQHTGWPQPPRGSGSHIQPDRRLIRLATVTSWGAKVFIVPLIPPANPLLTHELGETVALWVEGIGWSDYSQASAIAAGDAWGPQATVREPGGALESRFFEIVPDGVAKVVFYRLSALLPPARVTGSVTASVHNNIAVFQMKTTGAGASPIHAEWYAASGRLIKRVGMNTAASPAPTVLDVLGADGIGRAKFGASLAAVRPTINSLIGESGGFYQRFGTGDPLCGVDHDVRWSDQWTHNGLPILTAYFYLSKLLGYQYGDYGTLNGPRPPVRGPTLATTRGLRIGDTLARGQRLYGRTFALSSAQGGTWSVRTGRGIIDGYAWGRPKYGDISPQSVVATIDAGNVGCAALSP